MAKANTQIYTFNVSKLGEIFDLLLKDGLLKLTDGQIMSNKEDLANKNFVSGAIPRAITQANSIFFKKMIPETIQ